MGGSYIGVSWLVALVGTGWLNVLAGSLGGGRKEGSEAREGAFHPSPLLEMKFDWDPSGPFTTTTTRLPLQRQANAYAFGGDARIMICVCMTIHSLPRSAPSFTLLPITAACLWCSLVSPNFLQPVPPLVVK